MKLLTILLIIVTIVILLHRKFSNNNIVSRNDTSSYKFYLSILILFHHLALQTELYCFREFRYWGSIIVGNFLFISGYGLIASYKAKGPNYFTHFFSKRLLRIYIPFITATCIYIILSLLGIYEIYDWDNIIYLTFTKAITPLPYSWYVLFITIWYISFYLSFKYFSKYGILLQTVISLFYLLISIKYMGWGWYTPSLTFLAGIFYSKNKIKFNKSGFILLTLIIILALQIKKYPLNIYISIIYIPLVCIWAFELIKRININNILTKYLEKYSYEIYLTQGFSIFYFRKFIDNDLLYIIICLFTTIIGAILLNKISHPIYLLIQKKINERC